MHRLLVVDVSTLRAPSVPSLSDGNPLPESTIPTNDCHVAAA
jgi:hypothetical protein